MKIMLRFVFPIVLGFVLAWPSTSQAQILVGKEGPVVYGYHHLNTTNMDAQKKFFVDTLGGKLVKSPSLGGRRPFSSVTACVRDPEYASSPARFPGRCIPSVLRRA